MELAVKNPEKPPKTIGSRIAIMSLIDLGIAEIKKQFVKDNKLL
jgi:hypothetical protein